ncbi:hypothetical protein [Sphingobium sp. TKS]|nr:hypothetical protein [Sphingobium sp. TKS]
MNAFQAEKPDGSGFCPTADAVFPASRLPLLIIGYTMREHDRLTLQA